MYQQYNPYYQQRYPQPIMTQPETQYGLQNLQFLKGGLQGKQVDSLEVVKATDVPFDGSVSYFPLTDNSAIITKQLQTDGTSKITIFKPDNGQNIETRYLTSEDLKTAINGLNLDEIEDIKEEIKEIKKQLKRKGE